MRLLLMLLCLCLPMVLFGQATNKPVQKEGKITIQGYVVDTANTYLPFAHLVFTHKRSGHKNAAATDSKGQFSIGLQPGAYQLEASFLGYERFVQPYLFQKDTTGLVITLKGKSVELAEVEIKADLNNGIEHSATGMTFNIENDSLYQKLSVAEVLSYLPGVTVDDEQGVQLEGESAWVMINGKRRRLNKDMLINLLKNLQGDQLKKIELTHAPSAKYSGAERKIIDIQLSKQRKDGLQGSASSTFSNQNLSIFPMLNLDYKIGKAVFSGNSFPYVYFRKEEDVFSDRTLLDNSFSFDEVRKTTSKTNFGGYSFGVDYTFNKKHSAWVFAQYFFNNSDFSSEETTRQVENGALANTQANTNDNINDGKNKGISAAYRYDINEKGTRLDVAANYRKRDGEQTALNNNTINFNDETPMSVSENRNLGNTSGEQSSARIDFTLPIKDKKGNFESGVSFYRQTNARDNTFTTFDESLAEYVTVDNLSNSNQNEEENFSAYVNYGSKLGELNYSIGLRAEQIVIETKNNTNQQTFKNTFDNLLPIASLKYMLGPKKISNINLSYRQSYSLPPKLMLNPFEEFVNSNTIRRGNPNLKQSINHNISLRYTLRNKYFFNLTSNFVDRVAAATQTIEDGITVNTYQNLGFQTRLGFSFNTSLKLAKWWRVNISNSWNYNKLSDEALDNEVLNASLSCDQKFTLPKDFIFTANLSLNNGNANAFGVPNDFIRVNTYSGISKKLLDKKLTCSFGVADIFGVNNRNEVRYIAGNLVTKERRELQLPRVNFSISYNFASGEIIQKKGKKGSGAKDRF